MIGMNVGIVQAETISTDQEIVLTNEDGIQSVATFAGDSNIISQVDNKVYYIEDGQLMLLCAKEASVLSSGKNVGGIITTSTEQPFEFYKIDTSAEDLKALKSDHALLATILTRTNENSNSMGNVIAKLSVAYSSRGSGVDTYYYLQSATSSYRQVINEGVVPQTSKLYWFGTGDKYRNGSLVEHGSVGFTKNYGTPTFSNVTLMGNGEELRAFSLGVTYTLYCSRSVSIDVAISFK